MPEKYTDDDLRMIRLQDGDVLAFEELVAVWQGPLHRFFLRNTRCITLAEDLVQDTLLRLHRKSWDYLPTGRFRGWLFRIANNLLIDHARRSKRDVLLRSIRSSVDSHGEERDALNSIPSGMATPLAQTADQEAAQTVMELLSQLPEVQRRTFLLHHYDSLTLPEVADAMETSLPTTKSRLRLAREKLRYLLTCRGFLEEVIPEND